jgi:hypothetical protein
MNTRAFFEKLQGMSESRKRIVLWTIVGIMAIVMGLFWIKGTMDGLSSLNIGKIQLPNINSTLETASTSDQPILQNNTAGPKTYEWQFYGDKISFQYPEDWIIEKEFYLTPAQQEQGEQPQNIGLLVYPEGDSLDNIHFNGRQNACDVSQNHSKCLEQEGHIIFTDSKKEEVLKIFDQIISTLNIQKQ